MARLRVIALSMAWAGAGVVGVEVGVELEGASLVGMSSSHPMVLLGQGAQVKAQFGLFGDSVNLDAI